MPVPRLLPEKLDNEVPVPIGRVPIGRQEKFGQAYLDYHKQTWF